ncbi:LysM peptidoglycan-binding domain-containing protein [Pseudoalteromonas sp. MMG013]|uniref:LysM peptidoglycan-binding domain-containing protein n=1 Tax=unclassified Pseudoalteromonas TaxID=194690 RepID=UPI001B372DD9|nr:MULTISPECIES: LysM domain-containing protein [unclassified Pseudoalteromonas]MBQ4851951.1 LysM peptidoglycan-binding domain-containing protein [Pseudoalteromonas sp. MMG012]MBQ4863907.1 LysM peptidoglycan-binding domain-containing protein [Pseudoalteromonas sp. MMG013]
MHTVLKYTVQPGDTLALITISIRASAGVKAKEVIKANPQVNVAFLSERTLLKIPYCCAGGHFIYQTRIGDSVTSICEGLANAASLTVLDLIDHNYAISKHKALLDLSKLKIDQVLSIPYSPALHDVTAIP